MRRGRYLMAFVVLLAAVACRPAGEPYNTPNPDPVCIAAAGVEARVADLRALDLSTATREEVVTVVDQLRAAWITLYQQVRILAEAEATNMAVQIRNFQIAAAQLPPGTTAADAKDLLSEEIAALDAAWKALQGELGCPDLSAPATPSA